MPQLSSKTALKLRRLLIDRPGEYTTKELCRELQVSQTELKRLLAELEDKNLIRTELEDS